LRSHSVEAVQDGRIIEDQRAVSVSGARNAGWCQITWVSNKKLSAFLNGDGF
jgi:hypothetical protein